jgi:lysozyme
MKGIDISHYQTITDWDKLNSQDFIIHKCTQGTGYLDPTYKKNKTEIRQLSHPIFGAYHFSDNGDPIKEADWFLKNLGEVTKEDIICLDAESNETPEWCEKFLGRVESKLGIKPYIYAPVVNWNRALDYPLWVARYGPNDGKKHEDYPPKIGKWKDWTIWQYTSKGKVDGITGNVDMNISKDKPENTTMEFKPGKFIKLLQRDSKWSSVTIGKSKSTIGQYGCTITCVAMASTWFNCYHDPAWMAKNLKFQNDLLIWSSINEKTCFDFEWRFYNCDHQRIREALNNNRKVCLLQVYSRHWVLATSNLYTGYWTADPWTGTSKYYPNSAISGGAVLKI